MLITFKTRAYADITMFGDVALQLIRLMGRRDTVPSAIYPEDIPQALENLRAGAAAHAATDDLAEAHEDAESSKEYVSLHKRALPLIELLEAAQERNVPVMWEQEKKRF